MPRQRISPNFIIIVGTGGTARTDAPSCARHRWHWTNGHFAESVALAPSGARPKRQSGRWSSICRQIQDGNMMPSNFFVHGRPEAAHDVQSPKRQRSEEQRELPPHSQSSSALDDKTTGQPAPSAPQPAAIGAVSDAAVQQASPAVQPASSQDYPPGPRGDVVGVAAPDLTAAAAPPVCDRCYRSDCGELVCPFPGLEGYASFVLF